MKEGRIRTYGSEAKGALTLGHDELAQFNGGGEVGQGADVLRIMRKQGSVEEGGGEEGRWG